MTWYLWILAIIGYLLLWFVTSLICKKVFEASTKGMIIFLGFIWPMTIPLLLITAIFEGIGWVADFLGDVIKGRRR